MAWCDIARRCGSRVIALAADVIGGKGHGSSRQTRCARPSYENRIVSSLFRYLTCWQQNAFWLNALQRGKGRRSDAGTRLVDHLRRSCLCASLPAVAIRKAVIWSNVVPFARRRGNDRVSAWLAWQFQKLGVPVRPPLPRLFDDCVGCPGVWAIRDGCSLDRRICRRVAPVSCQHRPAKGLPCWTFNGRNGCRALCRNVSGAGFASRAVVFTRRIWRAGNGADVREIRAADARAR